AASSDLDEHADNAADHLPQEMRSFYADENEVAVFSDVEPLDEDERRLVLGALLFLSERLEVAHAHKRPRRLTHPLDIDLFLDPPDVRFRECRAAARDLIQVTARNGIVTRVEPMRNDVGGQDID